MSLPSRNLGIGLLGAARIAPMALMGPARDSTDVDITATAARRVERARQFATRYGIPTVQVSYEAAHSRSAKGRCRCARSGASSWRPVASTYAAQLRAFANAMQHGKPYPTDTSDDAVANMKIIDACYVAAGRARREPTPC